MKTQIEYANNTDALKAERDAFREWQKLKKERSIENGYKRNAVGN